MIKAVSLSIAAMDYFPQVGEYFAGGNALNQAIQFRQQGIESAFIGAVGKDEAGERIADLFRKASVDISHLYRMDGNTASNRIINDSSGERYGVDGAWIGGVYDYFRLSMMDWEFVDTCDIVVTHANCPDYPELLNRIRAEQFLAVDFLHMDEYELMRKSSHVADVIFSGGNLGMAEDLKKISTETGGLFVLTLGAQGSVAFRNGEVFEQEALPVDQVVDTTGCGDAFQAAFSGEYTHTRNVQAALEKGAQAGRIVAGRIGAAEWL